MTKAERLQELVSAVHNFSRSNNLEYRSTNLNAFINDVGGVTISRIEKTVAPVTINLSAHEARQLLEVLTSGYTLGVQAADLATLSEEEKEELLAQSPQNQ